MDFSEQDEVTFGPDLDFLIDELDEDEDVLVDFVDGGDDDDEFEEEEEEFLLFDEEIHFYEDQAEKRDKFEEALEKITEQFHCFYRRFPPVQSGSSHWSTIPEHERITRYRLY